MDYRKILADLSAKRQRQSDALKATEEHIAAIEKIERSEASQKPK
ncbi:MAG: hypothetical protein [Microvirus sp.]|nr:MAG: hypothetical protein [Microvirus sp.]